MRTTLTLDDDVYAAAQQLAQVSGRRLGEVLSELARRGLRPAGRPIKKGRFPTFEVPADAPMISPEKVQQILDEDGYF